MEVRLFPLDPELQAEVDEVVAAASKEMGPSSAEAVAVAVEDAADSAP